MMKFKFTYVKLNVYNYEACLHFYRDVLGFESVFSEQDDCTELNLSTVRLSLIKQKKIKGILEGIELISSSKRNNGISVSFQVRNLHEVCRQLKEQGVKFLLHNPCSFPVWEFSSTFCCDPDGNLIEIQQSLS